MISDPASSPSDHLFRLESLHTSTRGTLQTSFQELYSVSPIDHDLRYRHPSVHIYAITCSRSPTADFRLSSTQSPAASRSCKVCSCPSPSRTSHLKSDSSFPRLLDATTSYPHPAGPFPFLVVGFSAYSLFARLLSTFPSDSFGLHSHSASRPGQHLPFPGDSFPRLLRLAHTVGVRVVSDPLSSQDV